jgi:glycosyltransferase involved in cell wall biosynthesis
LECPTWRSAWPTASSRSLAPNAMASEDAARRVLFVDNQVNDFLLHRMVLARSLREFGFDIHVAVPQEPGLEEISRQGFQVHTFFLRRFSTQPLDELRCLASLISLYRWLRPTLVHHIGLKTSLYGGLATRITRVPAAVDTLTGLGHLFTARSIQKLVLRSVAVGGLRVSFSHKNHRVILQHLNDLDCLLAWGIDCATAVLIKGSGVNVSLFKPCPEPEGTPVVLMASRLLWEKGVGEFVAAARALRLHRLRPRFWLAGEPDHGHPSAVPTSLLERWHHAGDIEWLGWRDDMPALIAQSHVVCLPSYYGEGIPRILVEATAAGRPIVTTDAPGCRDVVRHRHNGLLVPVRNHDALIAAIAQLISDPPTRAAMGERGREIALSEFALEPVVEANLTVYRSLLRLEQARMSKSGMCDEPAPSSPVPLI